MIIKKPSEILYLDATAIMEKSVFEYIISLSDKSAQAECELNLIKRAAEIGKKSDVMKILSLYKKTAKPTPININRITPIPIATSSDGKILNTIDNFLKILTEDPDISKLKIRFNEQRHLSERIRDGKTDIWSDSDNSSLRNYIEKNYLIHNENKLKDALRIYNSQHSYNPIKEEIESVKWDGKSRIYTFIQEFMKCDDSDYIHEVSRLIFAGGIHRLYNPGCKFDDSIVFTGGQGSGKSTMVQWLSLLDEPYYREVSTIEGQKGMEAIEGGWICELSELLALTRTKEVEAIKSYISARADVYRRPYDENITIHPRRCIFIGTTNRAQFLTDKTGNRRFYPVAVHQTGYYIYQNQELIKNAIKQCWAEALELYKQNKLLPYADPKYKNNIEQMQANSLEEDYMVGYIATYIEHRKEVCTHELWENALNNRFTHPTLKDSKMMGEILASLGWKHSGEFFPSSSQWSKQRKWVSKNKIPDDSSL